MKQRYFIQLSYKGTNFHGWQIQPNAPTIQEELNKVLSTLLKEKIDTVGAGRTDTGVHASFFMAHFDSSNSKLENDENFILKMNHFIHKDIAIYKIFKVTQDANCRFDAISRTYKYYISRVKNPFYSEFSNYIYGTIDVKAMNKAASYLSDYIDFTSFSKLHTDVKTNNCKILHAEWKETDNELIFTIKADRFLRNMVRAIVGTLIDIGLGKLTPENFKNIIESKDRSKAGASAPAKGLFLTDIEY